MSHLEAREHHPRGDLDADDQRHPSIARRATFVLVLAGCAAVYPWLLLSSAALGRTVGSDKITTIVGAGVPAILAGLTVVGLSLAFARRVADAWMRSLCHLAVTTPTLFVALSNYAGIFDARSLLRTAWIILWATLCLIAIARPGKAGPVRLNPQSRGNLVRAHGILALVIVVGFLGPHIANHLTGFWSGAGHLSVMHIARGLYRNAAVEPLLLGLIAIQIAVGLSLAATASPRSHSWFSTLQTMSGGYVGIFFFGHLAAVLSARYGGADTDWNWLTSNDAGLLANLGSIHLVPHYWVGTIALSVHLACGLRNVFLKRGVSLARVNRGALAIMAFGALASTAILSGLLGFHLG